MASPGQTVADDTTSLLNDAEAQNVKPVTPLPKAQLATICVVRLMDPIAFTQIFPYINDFIAFIRATEDPSQIGFYSGLVESSFAATQLFSLYFLACLSDRIGRRPVIMVGALGVGLSTIYFGLSESVAELLVSRCIAGFFAGTGAVVQAVLGDITDNTNQAIAYPLYGLVWPIGSIVGPLIGGSLSYSTGNFSNEFGSTFFTRHPYFLPCLLAGLFSFVGAALAHFCLKETLPMSVLNAEKVRKLGSQSDSDDPALSGSYVENARDVSSSPSAMELLSIPIIRALCLSGFSLDFNYTSFGVVFVLFCYSPIQHGGLGFPPSIIGYTLATSGFIAGLAQVIFMPALLRRFEAAQIYNTCMKIWPCVFILTPLLNMTAKYGLDESTGLLAYISTTLLWVEIAFVLVLARIGGLAFSVSLSANLILVKSNSPSPSALGATNGLVQCFMCLARCISAVFASSAFALSEKHHLMGGYFWAVLLSCMALVGCSLGREISSCSQSTLNHDSRLGRRCTARTTPEML